MKLNVNHFKKLHSDNDMTVLQHPDGHEIKIAHKHLSPKMRGQLEALPMTASNMGGTKVQKLAEGGLTQSQDQVIKDQAPSSLPDDFEQRVKQEQVRLGMNAGLPITSTGENPQGVNLDKFRTEAETNMAKMAMENKVKSREKEISNFESEANKVKEQNAIRQQAGLPLIPNPEPAPGLMPQQAQPQMQQASGMLPQPGNQGLAQQDPYGTQAYSQNYLQGMNEQKQGIYGQAKAEGVMGNQQAQALQQGQNQLQTLQQNWQATHDQLNKERDGIIKDINAGHIDPNQYWNDKSTGGKISTAIGLILGGMGAGMLHQENPVMSMLNKEIDRNIAAQRVNLEKKNTLLQANREQFRNEADASAMTRVMLSDSISNQLKIAAAKATDPMAKARALQAAGQLDQQAAPLLSQIAMRRAILGNAGQQGGTDPSMAIRVIVPEGQQQNAYKELGEAQGMARAKDNILGSFDKLANLNTLGNRITSPLQTSKQVSAIRDPLIAGLSKETAGRFTESDAKMVGSLFPATGDSPETTATKRAQLLKLISEKMNFPLLDSFGIKPASFSRFNTSGQNKIKEAAPKF